MPLGVSKINGDFGEALVTYLLARDGVEVLHGPTVGFDLFAVDPLKSVFSGKARLIGISVKTRLLKGNFYYSSTIPTDAPQVSQAVKAWGAEPWLAVVVGSVGLTLEVMLLPYSAAARFRGRAKRGDVVSVSALESDLSGTVRTLLRETNPNAK